MGYDTRKPLSEQTGPGITSFPNYDSKPTVPKEPDLNQYPNYCRYPERAILPGKNEVGVSGLEAIPEGYCCYPIPMPQSNKGGVSYIFLPKDSKIEFWNEVSYDHLLKNVLRLSKDKRPKYFDYYSKIFPYGTVFSFDLSGLTYVSWMKNEKGNKFGFFDWYYTDNEDKKPYPKIRWTDPRTDWDKIVDEWGSMAQWVSAAAFFIAGFFTEGSTWLILAEMFTEGSLSIISAQRELEKGENIAAAFDLLFALTPFLKTSKFFTTIDNNDARSLVRSMRASKLNKNSTPQEIYSWYTTLNNSEKLTWSKMLKAGDEFSEKKLKKILGEGMESFKKYIKENPGLIHNIKWINNVAVKEITLQGLIGVLDVLTETFLGEKLDDEEKKKINTIYNNAKEISENLSKEVSANLIANTEKIKVFLKSKKTDDLVRDLNYIPKGKISADWFNTEIKDTLESVGGTYYEIDFDDSKSIPNNSVSQEEISKYISIGYKKRKDMSDEELKFGKKPIKLNGEWYWLVVGEKNN